MSARPPTPHVRAAAIAAALATLVAGCGGSLPDASGARSAGIVSSPGGLSPSPAEASVAHPTPASTGPISTASGPPPTTVFEVRGHLAVLVSNDDSSSLQVIGSDGTAVAAPALPGVAAAIASSRAGDLVARGADGRLWLARASPASVPPWATFRPRLAPTTLLPGPIVGVTWDRDGAGLLALATDPAAGGDRVGLVAIRAADGASVVTVVQARPGGGLAWSLAGGRRAFVARTASDAAVLATAVGSTVTLLAIPAYEVAFSADRETVAIVEGDGAIRTGDASDVLAGAMPLVRVPPPAGATAGNVALDAIGSQLAVAWRPIDGSDWTLVTYVAVAGGWQITGRRTFAATVAVVPAWLP